MGCFFLCLLAALVYGTCSDSWMLDTKWCSPINTAWVYLRRIDDRGDRHLRVVEFDEPSVRQPSESQFDGGLLGQHGRLQRQPTDALRRLPGARRLGLKSRTCATGPTATFCACFKELLPGHRDPARTVYGDGRKVLFLVFAIVSWVYKWVVTFFILKFMSTFPGSVQAREIISNFPRPPPGVDMVGWPAYLMGQSLAKRGRLPDMKNGRVSLTVMAGIAVVLGFFLVLPVSRIREHGIVQFRPEYLSSVYLTGEGVLKKVHVREGEYVTKGQAARRIRQRRCRQATGRTRVDDPHQQQDHRVPRSEEERTRPQGEGSDLAGAPVAADGPQARGNEKAQPRRRTPPPGAVGPARTASSSARRRTTRSARRGRKGRSSRSARSAIASGCGYWCRYIPPTWS